MANTTNSSDVPKSNNPTDKKEEDFRAPRISGLAVLINLILFVISILLITAGVALGQHRNADMFLRVNMFSTGITLLLLQVIHAGFSFRIVPINRRAIKLEFGAYDGDAQPGWIYVLWPFETLISVTKNMIEFDIPDSPEKIYHGDLTADNNEGVVPTGYTPALRITFAAPQKEGDLPVDVRNPIPRGEPRKIITIPKDDAYYKRNTTEIEASLGYCITNLRLFYETIGTVDSANSSMKDHAISGLNSRLPKFTLAEAMLMMEELGSDMKEDLTEYSKHWGISVVFFRFKQPGISHALNSSVSNVAIAGENLKKTKLDAEGTKVTLTQEGLGKANAKGDMLGATAQGLREITEVTNTPGGAYTMAVQSTEQALTAAKAVVVPADNLYGVITGAASVIKNIPDLATQPSPPSTPPEEKRHYGARKEGEKYGASKPPRGKKGDDKK